MSFLNLWNKTTPTTESRIEEIDNLALIRAPSTEVTKYAPTNQGSLTPAYPANRWDRYKQILPTARSEQVPKSAQYRLAKSLCAEVIGILNNTLCKHSYDKHKKGAKRLFDQVINDIKGMKKNFESLRDNFGAKGPWELLSMADFEKLTHLLTDACYHATGWERNLETLATAAERRRQIDQEIRREIIKAISRFVPDVNMLSLAGA
jgi:hypothetical protein